MLQEDEKATRDWREVVADVYKQSDPENICELAEELDRALRSAWRGFRKTLTGINIHSAKFAGISAEFALCDARHRTARFADTDFGVHHRDRSSDQAGISHND
jgi:hypothetical protein